VTLAALRRLRGRTLTVGRVNLLCDDQYPTIRVSDYIEVDGEKQHEQPYDAEQVTVQKSGRGPRHIGGGVSPSGASRAGCLSSVPVSETVGRANAT